MLRWGSALRLKHTVHLSRHAPLVSSVHAPSIGNPRRVLTSHARRASEPPRAACGFKRADHLSRHAQRAGLDASSWEFELIGYRNSIRTTDPHAALGLRIAAQTRCSPEPTRAACGSKRLELGVRRYRVTQQHSHHQPACCTNAPHCGSDLHANH